MILNARVAVLPRQTVTQRSTGEYERHSPSIREKKNKFVYHRIQASSSGEELFKPETISFIPESENVLCLFIFSNW